MFPSQIQDPDLSFVELLLSASLWKVALDTVLALNPSSH